MGITLPAVYPSVGWLSRYRLQALIINLDWETVCYWITRFRFTLWRRNRHGNRPTSHCSCTSPPRVDHPIHNNKTAALMSLHWLLFASIFVFYVLSSLFSLLSVYCVHKRVDNSRACERHASLNSSVNCCYFLSLTIAEHGLHFFLSYKHSIIYWFYQSSDSTWKTNNAKKLRCCFIDAGSWLKSSTRNERAY